MAKKLTKKADAKKGDDGGKAVPLVNCTYAGQDYSPGSNVEMPGAGGGKVTKTCNGQTGSWETLS